MTDSATRTSKAEDRSIEFHKVTRNDGFPGWASRAGVAQFFHETMQPYHDTLPDVEAALDYALVPGKGQGGFLMIAHESQTMLGALLMLETGMGGYIPKHLLLFVSVSPDARGRGIGARLIEASVAECDGDVKLHVEYENPAKRLYERLGFTTKYAEMRLANRRETPDR